MHDRAPVRVWAFEGDPFAWRVGVAPLRLRRVVATWTQGVAPSLLALPNHIDGELITTPWRRADAATQQLEVTALRQ
eukprot:CAMPEP_0173412328 /NCGR_PEP_ID=MMETSP1356-20130122/79212_1 /TAXON_ID=77927 ORGANISM="Hemiselmis virescens, Strain PCC157" /NCGR_SAMPLE_ID=MMETSP1356 /ASSEMBLY_ACC=CAM_ASM_000847 /LENGTH=76 /DNA_ID=CAMNT_0014374205 /DNA_START=310 /DNA_END=540 /DNA_ORIENTATION=+